MTFKRIDLISVTGLQSSYFKKSKPTERLPIEALGLSARCTPEMFESLKKLNQAVIEQKGTLFITDLLRQWDVQERLRNEYEASVKDPNIKDKAYAAVPGGSFHQAGKAVDFDVRNLSFQNIPKEQWLKKFWDLAKPLGFKPIIKIPDLNMSECWHFDHPGVDWLKAYDYMDDFSTDSIDYTSVAKCCILDIGAWDPKIDSTKTRNMFIQTQLIRLGKYEIGSVDGIIGPKCVKAISEVVFEHDLDLAAISLSKK